MNRRLFMHTVGLSSFGLLTACAAGNFGLTRQLGGWNRRFSVIPRVLLYIVLVIVPVYELTLLFDFILNNTVEFWTGSALSAKNETFEKDGHRVEVAHSRFPMRRSVFTHYDSSHQVQSVSEVRETAKGTIEIFVNGDKKAEVKTISEGLTEISAYKSGTFNQRFVVQNEFVDVAHVRRQIYPNSLLAQR